MEKVFDVHFKLAINPKTFLNTMKSTGAINEEDVKQALEDFENDSKVVQDMLSQIFAGMFENPTFGALGLSVEGDVETTPAGK